MARFHRLLYSDPLLLCVACSVGLLRLHRLAKRLSPPKILVPVTAVFRPLTITQPSSLGPNTSWCIGVTITLSFLQFLYSQSQLSIPCLRLPFADLGRSIPAEIPQSNLHLSFCGFCFLKPKCSPCFSPIVPCVVSLLYVSTRASLPLPHSRLACQRIRN